MNAVGVVMADGSNTAALAYDVDHARDRMVTAGQNAGTTYYLNDPSSGAAPCTSGGATLNYFVLDHLGSITVITDGAGNVLQRLSYDAWGKRRNADGTALNCTSGLASPSGVNRGFTGQEMIDGVCLINFNARIYDPSIGRFMSADPVVGDETVPQELNRYSYVLNDPLSLTDPSGLCGVFCIFKDVLDVLAVFFPVLEPLDQVVDITAQFVAIAENPEQGLLGILVGPGLAQVILTGNSKEFALNAFEAGLFYESGDVLQKAGPNGILGLGHEASAFILHGLVGGLTSEIRSGNFASGFLAGGLSSLAPLRIGQASLDSELAEREAAALGGIGSVLGGGKFEDGAQTGTFGYLFNQQLHGCGGHANCPVTPQQQADARVQAGPFFAVVGGGAVAVGACVFGGCEAVAGLAIWDLLAGGATAEGAAVFVDGTMIERSYEFGGVTVQALGEVSVSGTSLTISDIAIYPSGAQQVNIGTGAAMSMFNSIATEAEQEGFTSLTISGVRYSGSNPGRLVNITRTLGGN